MISTFSEPYRVTIKSPQVWGSTVGLLMGLTKDEKQDQQAYLSGAILCEDGSIQEIPAYDFTVDWRYSAEKDAFFDLDTLADADGVSTSD